MARLLFVIVLVLSLAATVGAQEQIVIRMYGGYADDGGAGYPLIEHYLREYERLNPHIKIENLGREHDPEKLITLFIAGEAPDIIEAGTHHIYDLYSRGLLMPVPEELAAKLRAEIYPISIESLTHNGKLMGVPIENMSTGILYNKQLFAESGIAAPPTTVAELEQIGRLLMRQQADGTVLRPGIADPGEGWTLHYHMLAMLKAEGGQVLDADGNLALDSDATRRVFEMFYDWAGGPARTGFLGLGWHWHGQFNMGDVPMMFAFPWFMADLERNYPGRFPDDFGAAMLPQGSAGYGAMHYGHGYGVNANTKHPEEVWKLLEWLSLVTGPEGVTPIGHVMAAIGSLPLAKSDVASPMFERNAELHQGFIESLAHAWTETVWAQHGLVYINIGYEFLPVLNGEKSLQQGVADLVLKNQNDMNEFRRQRGQ